MKLIEFLFEMTRGEALSLFGVDSNYTTDELKKKYRSLSMKHHPDRGGNLEQMKNVNAAYDILKSTIGQSSSSFSSKKTNTTSQDSFNDEYDKNTPYQINDIVYNSKLDEEVLILDAYKSMRKRSYLNIPPELNYKYNVRMIRNKALLEGIEHSTFKIYDKNRSHSYYPKPKNRKV